MATPETVWARLWDLDRHTALIPLTTVRSVDGRPLSLGSRFVAETNLGVATLVDRMVVTGWDPPHRAVIEKVGRPLRGRVVVTLHDSAVGGTRVWWEQTIGAVDVPDVVVRALVPLVSRGYQSVLDELAEPAPQDLLPSVPGRVY